MAFMEVSILDAVEGFRLRASSMSGSFLLWFRDPILRHGHGHFIRPDLCAGGCPHILRMDYTALGAFVRQACLPPEGSVMELGYDPLRAFGGILGSSGSTPAAAMIARPNSSPETVNPPPVSEMGTTACPSSLVTATKR